MARLRKILGVVVLVLGVLMIVLSLTVTNQSSQTIPDLATGSVAVVTAQIYGGGSIALSWSGAASATQISVYSCTDSSCSGITSTNPIAKGSGASGSLSFSVSGGHSYAITETGTSGSITATAVVTGIGLLTVLGIVVAVVGAVLAIWPSKAKAPSSEEETGVEATEEPMAEETVVAPAPEPSSGPSPAAGGAGARAPIKCAHCGTMNEPWLVNCRWCKRPLTSTQK